MNYENLITGYETDVQFPDVSGMEHLEMLMTRSEIAKNEKYLSDEQRQRVFNADILLLQQAVFFYQSIKNIADLNHWRSDENVSPTYWWWYLDVLAQMPKPVIHKLGG
jgi:hypothetical protein